MEDITVVLTNDKIFIDCLTLTPEIRAFMDNLEACNMVNPTWLPGCYSVPESIVKYVYVTEDGIYIKKRWCQDLCAHGGIPLHPFVAWQLHGFNVLEQIVSGQIKVRFYVYSKEYMVDWPDSLPDRKSEDEEDTKRLVKVMKRTYSKDSGNQGCPVHGRKMLKDVPRSWMCCMCNKHDRLLAHAR